MTNEYIFIILLFVPAVMLAGLIVVGILLLLHGFPFFVDIVIQKSKALKSRIFRHKKPWK